jgi:ABC-2 type transport system ATP-binding protein
VSRAELWRLVAGAAAAGTAVVAATSYLDEAERAASVLVLDQGVPLLVGAPDELVAGMPGVLLDAPERPEHGVSWRHGARWRGWVRDGTVPPGAEPATAELEDAVIVAALDRRDRMAANGREGRAA